MRKYRRIVRKKDSSLQGYQITLIAFGATLSLNSIAAILLFKVSDIALFSFLLEKLKFMIGFLGVINLLLLILFVFFFKQREQISMLEVEEMNPNAKKLSKKLLRLFNDKQITDVLKLSNPTRFGDEMPQIVVWVNDECDYGYIAVENIGNYEKMDKEKYEQRMSGILCGKYRRFAVVSSALSKGDAHMIFYFEDTLTSNRLIVKEDSLDSLKEFINEDVHAIRLANDLVWHTDITPHMSIIARTRSGKSVLAGRYMARLMLLQGWRVEFNSAKYDRYVKEFNGKSGAVEIIKRAEYWLSVMLSRLEKINEAGKEKYLDLDMSDIGIFFDEIGNLNAELELERSLKKRWETAINRLTATGASAGIHVICISQYANTQSFLNSLARANSSEAVIMLGGAAGSGDERRFLLPGCSMPQRSYGVGQGVARVVSSGHKWENLHFYETPLFIN